MKSEGEGGTWSALMVAVGGVISRHVIEAQRCAGAVLSPVRRSSTEVWAKSI